MGPPHGVSHQIDVRGELRGRKRCDSSRDASVLVLPGGDAPNGVLPEALRVLKATARSVVGGSPASSAPELVVRAGRGIHVSNDVTELGRRLTEAIERPPVLTADDEFIAGLNREEQSRRLLTVLERL